LEIRKASGNYFTWWSDLIEREEGSSDTIQEKAGYARTDESQDGRADEHRRRQKTRRVWAASKCVLAGDRTPLSGAGVAG